MDDQQQLVSVAIDGLPHPLTYAVPENIAEISLGDEVVVPLGRQQRRGWVVGLDEAARAELDALASKACNPSPQPQLEIFSLTSTPNLKKVLATDTAFLPVQIPLFRWMSEYYGVPLAEILQTVIPKRYPAKEVSHAVLISVEEAQRSLSELHARASNQTAILRHLLTINQPVPLSDFPSLLGSLSGSGAIRAACRALEKKGLVRIGSSLARFEPAQHPASYVITPESLTQSQQTATKKLARSIRNKQFDPYLLLGVTGSGKTEVYLHAIQEALNDGGSALLLVPEISLTPQLVDQLTTRLAQPLALLHSQVGGAERWRYWEGLRAGDFRVAVGARSALFAPIRDLRLIIIDEEHETSYKQSDGFRYHGRDVAVMRAKTENCTLVLGSATPSLETLLNVQRKRYKLIELPERVHQRPVPEIEIIDLLKIPLRAMPTPTISPALHEALTTTLQEGEQAVILYNKRGFSSYLQCDSCGEAVCCPDCSVALTYHKAKSVLLCHYCGRSEQPPEACGYCRNPQTTQVETPDAVLPGALTHRGAGTERVVEDLALLFPNARLARMDRDTVGAKDSYRTILHSMRSGGADILVGTQMIAKGHDLPGVTLVGVIDADIGLHAPDFRTSERAYQLITQAAGRAGRGLKQGRVLVQTRQATHPTILATATGRFLAFARFQLEQREKLGYPPHGRLLRLIISAEQQRLAISTAEQLSERITQLAAKEGISAQILGPAPAPHQRLRGLYRWHLLIKSNSATSISKLAFACHHWRRSDFRQVRIAVDVDPVDML